MHTQAFVISALFQLTAAVGSIGRVKTASHVVSRRFNAVALGAVAVDFAIKFICTGAVDFLVGLIVFGVLTARTLLILGFGEIERSTVWRRVACAIAFVGCAIASVLSQLCLGGMIRPITLLALSGIGLGCLGEASNQMVVRRRCIFGMGCIMAVFGLLTSAWGLVFKNVVSDVGATVYAMIKYRDLPLRVERIRQYDKQAARWRRAIFQNVRKPLGEERLPLNAGWRMVRTNEGPRSGSSVASG